MLIQDVLKITDITATAGIGTNMYLCKIAMDIEAKHIEPDMVDLRCDNSLMKTMVDRFGEDVTTLAYDMTSFRIQTEVSASPTFFGWMFGFDGKVQILGPESVNELYRQMIAKADENMQEDET